MTGSRPAEPVALVTGGAGGIGQVITRALVETGVRVAVLDIDGDHARSFARAINVDRDKEMAIAITGDVADESACNDAVTETVSQFGRIDILVNNAGVGMASIRLNGDSELPGILDVTPEQWRRFFAVNTDAAFLMTRAALPEMKRNGWGRIINNTTSFFTMLRAMPYGASKAALEAASAVWASELEGTGVTVNVVVPGGPTDTPFIPQESGMDRTKMIKPAVMGPPVAWLASADADTVTGRRFVAANWDPSLAPADAAQQSGAPIGWPDLTKNVVWLAG